MAVARGIFLTFYLAAVLPAAAQISPGPLSSSHAELDNNRDCTRCHERGEDGLDHRCLDCHGGVRRLVENRLGFHGRQGRQDCARCHPEHAGREFQLIEWADGGEDKYRHARTGWPLTGRHDALKCEQCHIPKYQQEAYLAGEPRRDRNRTWLGLDTACRSCHVDPHRGELGNECSKCHGTSQFKPAARLDHSRTEYPLTGKHADIACNKCHLVPGKVYVTGDDGKLHPRFTGLAFRECSDCHRDIHSGALGPNCSSCHVTTGFKQVDRTRFDHDKTGYPLRGRHRQVRCEGCHDPVKAWGRKPKFGRCADCHKDAHGGKATLAGKVVDCASCHSEDRFAPSTYTVVQHRKSEYPLEGRHAAVACGKCHTKGPAGTVLRPNSAACRDCHEDAHGGQLAAKAGACDSCHTVAGWKPSTYERSKHDLLPVTLEGQHGRVECSACHGPSRPGLGPVPSAVRTGPARVALRGIETRCRSCHLDVHQGKFKDECGTCHGLDRFSPSTVDVERHRRFRYALEGGHQAVPCIDCHKVLLEPVSRVRLLQAEGPVRKLVFEEPHRRCTDCHRDPHQGQFAYRPDGGACDGCHVVDRFRPASRFDHERDAKFALKGGHVGVACRQCHKQAGAPDEKGYVIYRPMAGTCRDCHRKAERTGR